MQQKYTSGVKRQKLPEERVDQLCDFVAGVCPTKSGEKSVTHHQYTTDDSLYSAYRKSIPNPVSFTTFYKIKRWMRVRRAGRYLGQFDCSKCCLFNKLQHKPELTGEEGEEMRKCIRHRDTRLFQQQHYQSLRAALQPRQLLVLMDFTSAYLTPKIGHAVNFSVVQDCIVVLEYISNGERMRENIDFLCDCPDTNKNDYHFVLHVWLLLFHFKKLIDHFDCIDVWTDGGPHHFKARFCQWMWHWLSQTHFAKRRISHHFFASYHGHSLADAHAASIKRLIRTEYNMSQLQRFDTTTLAMYWGPEDAAAVGRLIKKSRNTEICVIPQIDRDPKLKPDPQPLVHIKQQHRYDYENGLCFRSERSAGTEKKLFSFVLR
jgi:hypothetical protein